MGTRFACRLALYSFLLILLTLAAAPIVAETIAVAVYDVDDHLDSGELLLLLEEGVMDALFGAGHIVFDIDLHESDETYLAARAAVEAELGGAQYVMLCGVTFRTVGGRGLLPDITTITVIDIPDGSDYEVGPLAAASLPRYDELDSQSVSLALGAASADAALAGIMEVGE